MILCLLFLHDFKYTGYAYLDIVTTFIASVFIYIASLYVLRQKDVLFFVNKLFRILR